MSPRHQYSCSALIITGIFLCSNTLATPIEDIYHKLVATYPEYNNITYADPLPNYLAADGSWLIQTPDAWGHTLAQYNSGITATATGENMDKLFHLPTCENNQQCSVNRSCYKPVFGDLNTHSLCLGNESEFQTRIYNDILSANQTVDITTLQPTVVLQSAFSDDAFTPTLQNALIQLAVKANFKKEHITVRLLQGGALPITSTANQNNGIQQPAFLHPQRDFIKQVINSPFFPKNTPYFDLYLGTERSCYVITGQCDGNADQKSLVFQASWNHGKIIDIDHSKIITGGENFWGKDYLETNPVNDLNMEISGPVVKGAEKYIHTLWQYLDTHQGKAVESNLCASYHDGKTTDDCPPANEASPMKTDNQPQNTQAVTAMYVSKLNNNVLGKAADGSELARVIAFKNAKSNIKISQQALFFKLDPYSKQILHPIPTIEGNTISALATAISHNVVVDIITSNMVGMSYSSEVPSTYVHDAIAQALLKLDQKDFPTLSAAQAQVKQYLTIKTIQFSRVDTEGKKTMNHDKLWIVDDQLFYIGSHNLYPSALQQFGVIVEDDGGTAIGQLETQLWNPLWSNSQP